MTDDDGFPEDLRRNIEKAADAVDADLVVGDPISLEDLVEALRADTELAERHSLHDQIGIYEQAWLGGPDGERYELSDVYFWAQRMDGHCNVDIPSDGVPADVALADCHLTINTPAGDELLSGQLRDDGNRQDGLGTISVCVLTGDPDD